MTDHGDDAADSRYTAYSYLPAGDIRQFELAPEFGRVPPYTANLTKEQQERAGRLLAGSLVISLRRQHIYRALRSIWVCPCPVLRSNVTVRASPPCAQPRPCQRW